MHDSMVWILGHMVWILGSNEKSTSSPPNTSDSVCVATSPFWGGTELSCVAVGGESWSTTLIVWGGSGWATSTIEGGTGETWCLWEDEWSDVSDGEFRLLLKEKDGVARGEVRAPKIDGSVWSEGSRASVICWLFSRRTNVC